MSDTVKILKDGGCIQVIFDIEDDNVMEIGERLQDINEDAYMNGYNWDAVIRCYIEINAPKLDGCFDSDPEAGMYAAYFSADDEGEENAEALAEIIRALISDEELLTGFVSDHGDEIEWE